MCIKGKMSCEISETLWPLDEMKDYDWGEREREMEREKMRGSKPNYQAVLNFENCCNLNSLYKNEVHFIQGTGQKKAWRWYAWGGNREVEDKILLWIVIWVTKAKSEKWWNNFLCIDWLMLTFTAPVGSFWPVSWNIPVSCILWEDMLVHIWGLRWGGRNVNIFEFFVWWKNCLMMPW